MSKPYITSTFLQNQDEKIYAVFGWSQREKQEISAKSWLRILEIFVPGRSVEESYHLYQNSRSSLLSEKAILEINRCKEALESDDFIVSLANYQLTVTPHGWKSVLDKGTEIDLTQISQQNYQVLPHLFSQQLQDDVNAIDTLAAFTQLVELIESFGLLSPATYSIDWGDFKRKFPICHVCGFTRGTPIDRYYLRKFVEEIKEQVVGSVLEIGGVPKDREFYDFSDRPEYCVLNLEAGKGVDIVGDVHNSSLIAPNSVDSVVIFNVLEHCYAPWEAVQNIHRWLKVGGKCFCLVPNAQRLHDRPADYWRPLPDGIAWLFKDFSQQKLYVYGNPLSVVASFHGIAVEEVSTEDLDAFHPDYPVVTCVVAEK